MTRDIEDIDTEFAGSMKIRFIDIKVTDYDDEGEQLVEEDVGMSRFQFVSVDGVDGNGVLAQYYADLNTIKLFDVTTGSELAAGSTARLRVMVVGR